MVRAKGFMVSSSIREVYHGRCIRGKDSWRKTEIPSRAVDGDGDRPTWNLWFCVFAGLPPLHFMLELRGGSAEHVSPDDAVCR